MYGVTEILSGSAGPILGVLALLSVLSVALILMRAVALVPALRGRSARAEAMAQLREGDGTGARTTLGNGNAPGDEVVLRGLDLIARKRFAALEADLSIAGNAASAEFFKGIRALETIAMISPLLGLLGTVLGMIQSFQDLELAEGAANAALLAGGIWQALLTTAAGLIVALPAAAAAALLSARAEAATSELETIINCFIGVAKTEVAAS